MKNKPWRFALQASGELEIFLYDVIGEDLFGGTSAAAFQEELSAAGNLRSIRLRVNSPGGNAFDGIAIYNALLSHGARVTAQVDGLAASIASTIIMAASEIAMADNSMMMIHNPYAGLVGDAAEMRRMAGALDNMKKSMVAAYQRHTARSADEVSAMMDAETWMGAEEAEDAGFCETILTPEQPVAMAASIDLSRFRHIPAAFAARLRPHPEGDASQLLLADREKKRLQLELLKRL
ncbi:MAG: Clp protease ClpP [Acidobacteriia bacterium]|nr:Clp protease ClpP [Terriglobia bacterium]